jgi:uncharacterized DUF497 family protein
MVELNGRLFDWDIKKNLINIEKHGVSFKMAASAFFDPQSIIFDDESHSDFEDRFILMGLNKFNNLLIVCHCYRDEGEVVRIISARKADKNEIHYYNRRNSDGY